MFFGLLHTRYKLGPVFRRESDAGRGGGYWAALVTRCRLGREGPQWSANRVTGYRLAEGSLRTRSGCIYRVYLLHSIHGRAAVQPSLMSGLRAPTHHGSPLGRRQLQPVAAVVHHRDAPQQAQHLAARGAVHGRHLGHSVRVDWAVLRCRTTRQSKQRELVTAHVNAVRLDAPGEGRAAGQLCVEGCRPQLLPPPTSLAPSACSRPGRELGTRQGCCRRSGCLCPQARPRPLTGARSRPARTSLACSPSLPPGWPPTPRLVADGTASSRPGPPWTMRRGAQYGLSLTRGASLIQPWASPPVAPAAGAAGAGRRPGRW